MGKWILLLVGAVTLGVSQLLFSGQRASVDTRDAQNNYQYLGIARGHVESGFDRGISAIKRDLMDVPTEFPRSSMKDGYHDLSIRKNLYGDLDVIVEAYSGEASWGLEGNVIFSAPLPGALLLEDDVVDFSATGFYQISGVDRRMPSIGAGSGFNEPVRGIITTENHASALAGELDLTSIVGIGSSPDDPVNQGSIVGGFSEDEMEAFYQEAILNATKVLTPNPSGNVSESAFISEASSSSPGNPAIIRARGNLNLTGSVQGYGMLIVEDGDFNVYASDFDWEGLIMVRKEFEDTVAVSLQNTTINGGMIAYDYETTPQQGQCVPDYQIDGDEAIVHDHFALRIEVLGAAITYGGTYDVPVTARIHVGDEVFEPWGDYGKALDGNVNTGNTGITYLWEPEEIFEAGSVISIDARSWLRSDGTDGTQESHWYVYMEEQSTHDGQQIELLTDNDPVPNVGGFMGQYSVEEFLDDYIENDALVLDANQAVSLFELGATDTGSSAFDMQDLVIVVTMIDASQGGCVPGGGTSRLEIDLNNATEIHYSSEAIAKLGLHLGTVRDMTTVLSTKSVAQGGQEHETLAFGEGVEVDDQEEDEGGHEGGSTQVTICHKPNNSGGTTKSIPEPALAGHLGHGDYLGACSGGN